MVHCPESTRYRGADKRLGGPALALRIQPMATTLVGVETRQAETCGPEAYGPQAGNQEKRNVVRCDHCALVQYLTSNALCRKCHSLIEVDESVVLAPQLVAVQADSSSEAGLQVASQVKEIRNQRHLSQRQLALLMEVPRTYISKIE